LDTTELNYEVLSLVNHVSSKITPESVGLTNQQLSLYRNYFIQKTVASLNVDSATHALSALKLFNEDIVLQGG
jgi:hypothetical protein